MIHPTTLLMLAMSDGDALDRRARRAVEVREALERRQLPARRGPSLVARFRAAIEPATPNGAPSTTCRADGTC